MDDGGGEVSGISLPKICVKFPTEVELQQRSAEWYASVGLTFLDNYPKELVEISPKTVLIKFPKDLAEIFYDVGLNSLPKDFQEISDQIDQACNWHEHFIRLNSRSPKDSTYPQMPFTCAGRQALHYIRCSERCLEDLIMFFHSDHEAYIAVRERIYIREMHEMRCFVLDGKFHAAAQYHRGLETHVTGLYRQSMEFDTRSFVRDTIIPRLHIKDVVVDICWDYDGPRFLEINPYGLSDPVAAGSYQEIENGDGRFFWYPLSGEPPHA